MKIGERKNEYGRPLFEMVCETCGEEYTVTGPDSVDGPGWENCLAPTCKSYDIERDLDLLLFPFEAAELDTPRVGGPN